jgi:hypothetical protein
MLALEIVRTVSADRLVEGLWGEEPPSSAPKMVQLYVSHLRRVLDGDGARIVTRGRGYELQLSGGKVDVDEVARLLEAARPREALALWRGEPLADVADEPFAVAEIRRLDELGLRATELAIDLDRRIMELAPAVPMTNHRAVVLVSKRVGNVQQHPQWFTLLDQLWVR